uniref:Uncharacterized protein n=1 Tax=Amphimedon queenslandica TaxID=400682 RepID=A0A1X7U3K2_AMPQE
MEESVKELWQDLLLRSNLLESRPPDPLNHITNYLTRLSLQSTPLSQAVDAAISLQYTSLCTGSFNDQVYEIYSILTDDTYDGLAGGISNQIYKEFITRFISKYY